jgi:hypothetical protein
VTGKWQRSAAICLSLWSSEECVKWLPRSHAQQRSWLRSRGEDHFRYRTWACPILDALNANSDDRIAK